MTTHDSPESLGRAADRLMLEYGDRLSPTCVLEVIQQACTDLRGQVVPDAMPEMLHRLVRHRLSRLPERSQP